MPPKNEIGGMLLKSVVIWWLLALSESRMSLAGLIAIGRLAPRTWWMLLSLSCSSSQLQCIDAVDVGLRPASQ